MVTYDINISTQIIIHILFWLMMFIIYNYARRVKVNALKILYSIFGITFIIYSAYCYLTISPDTVWDMYSLWLITGLMTLAGLWYMIIGLARALDIK